MSNFPPGVKVGAPKNDMSQIILYWAGKVDSVLGTTQLKIHIILENALNKSCWALNFVQKSQWRICLSPPGVELGASKIDKFQILYRTEMGKYRYYFDIHLLYRYFWYLCCIDNIDIDVITPLE